MDKKSATAINEKVSTTYIPDDISFSLRSKLPLKSFKRFECVCKSWSLLSENQHFTKVFCNNLLSNSLRGSYYDGASLILKVPTWLDLKETQLMYILSGDKFENKLQLNFSNLFEVDENFQIFGFGSINGTLLLHQCCENGHILWDPATEKFNLFPPSQVDSYVSDVAKVSFKLVSYLHGFGYDCTTNDYKVIHYIFSPY